MPFQRELRLRETQIISSNVVKIHIHMQNIYAGRTLSFWIRTGLLISSDTGRETQFLKASYYADHTILTPSQRVAHLVMFKISIPLCRSRSEKLNRMSQRSNLQLLSFQNPLTLKTTSSGHDVIHTPATSCPRIYYDKL